MIYIKGGGRGEKRTNPRRIIYKAVQLLFLDKNDHLQEQIIKDMLSDKMERIQRREAYTKTPQERSRSCKL